MSTSPKPAVKLLNKVLREMWDTETPEIRQEILADLEGWGTLEREHVVEEKAKMTGELENRTACQSPTAARPAATKGKGNNGL